MSMHDNKAEEQASLLSNLFALENSASVGCACTQARSNLYNYVPVIYDMWSLEIQRNDIIHKIIKRTPGHGLETDFS